MKNNKQRIFITGDKHGNFDFLTEFCHDNKTTVNDILIILGDTGLNYYVSNFSLETNDKIQYQNLEWAKNVKKNLSQLPITLFCIHGNHEARPETVNGYELSQFQGGNVYIESAFPNLIFAIDGECYTFCNKKMIVIGGAYSVDKFYRIQKGLNWFKDEQPSNEIKQQVINKLNENKWHVDFVLSHTVPFKFIPREMFLSTINQTLVDNTTELFLDEIEDKLSYEKWFCGHYHTNKKDSKIQLLFDEIQEISE
ncbi:MAG: metallophosphoesterase [Erysipelotrichaceae bacterium]